MATTEINDRTYNGFHLLATQKAPRRYQVEIPQYANLPSQISILDDGYSFADNYEFNASAEVSFTPFCGFIR